jgi:dTDP-4-dehydrorhamnose 3,5-epimerase
MNNHTTVSQESLLDASLGFKLYSTTIDDVFLIERPKYIDDRGVFGKTFNEEVFRSFKLSTQFKESVFSISSKNVLRGMHYQQYPFGHVKLVSVLEGEILDVVVCIDEEFNAPNKGKFYSVVLSADNSRTLYIPDGYAHGFLCLSDKAIVSYQTTTVYNADADRAIHWNSFGFKWPIDNPNVSEKDKNAPHLNNLTVK